MSFPSPSTSAVLACQFQEWYPEFTTLTFQSRVINLPPEFTAYLQSDGVFLTSSSEAAPRPASNGEWERVHGSSSPTWDESDDESDQNVPSFPDLEESIRSAITELGGAVIPKLNWSCPKDVGWLSPHGNAKCHNPDEVILLLKSSDSIVHDICHAFDSCEDKARSQPPAFYLVLRKYFDLNPEMEFRCFVYDRQIVAICQRNVMELYPGLREQTQEIAAKISGFFDEQVRHKFMLPNYVLDVYITRKGKVRIVDFNTWGGATLPLLFDWVELNALSSHRAVEGGSGGEKNVSLTIRVVETATQVRPGMRALCGVPLDLYDVGHGSAIEELMQRMQEESEEVNVV